LLWVHEARGKRCEERMGVRQRWRRSEALAQCYTAPVLLAQCYTAPIQGPQKVKGAGKRGTPQAGGAFGAGREKARAHRSELVSGRQELRSMGKERGW
jgi:hypothetical protein